jgi:cell division initiation protein
MDLTPQRLREVEFKERWRGYDPEEVDDLLERVAAGIEDIENRVRQATERAVRAEQEAKGEGDADETLRRTLVLAQRTADAAIADAKERAGTLVSDAEQRAATLVSDAEQQAATLVAEADAEARRITAENETRLRENVSTLESARATLQADVDALDRYLTEEREQLRSTLHALIDRIDTGLQHGDAPAVDDVEVPEPQAEAEVEAEGEIDTGGGAEVTEAADADARELDLDGADDGEATQAHDVLVDDADDAKGSNDESELVLSGPGREIDTEDDAFFAELRGALEDDEPLGPRDEEPVPDRVGASGPPLFDQEVPEEGRLGPFLRRKRREA